MKKEYSTPIVEKIAFNYRDLVVAASGNSGSGGAIPDSNDVIDTPKSNGWGTSACSALKELSEGITIWAGCLFG